MDAGRQESCGLVPVIRAAVQHQAAVFGAAGRQQKGRCEASAPTLHASTSLNAFSSATAEFKWAGKLCIAARVVRGLFA